jgi:hypothetical protein
MDRLGSFDRRSSRRKVVKLDSLAFASSRRHARVKMIDISATGCRLSDIQRRFAQGECLTFTLNGEFLVEGIVRWWNDHDCGIEFLEPLPQRVMASVA